MLKFIKRHRLVVTFLCVAILLTPFSISKPAESDRMAVVTSVGIDKTEQGIELSVNTIVPNSGQAGGGGGTDGTVKTVSATGTNVSTAFANITLVLGKFPGLAHCDSIILNKNLFEENVLEYLDFFIRTNNLTSNAAIMVAQNTAKEVVETAASQKGLRAVSVSEILLLNTEYALSKASNIDEFYLNTFSPSKTSMLPLITVGDSGKSNPDVDGGVAQTALNTNAGKGSQSDSGSSQSSGSSKSLKSGANSSAKNNSTSTPQKAEESGSGNGSPEKIIKNEGKGVIVKNGKIVATIIGDEMNGLNLLSLDTKRGHIQIKNVNTPEFSDASLTFEIFNKKTSYSGKFVNGKPVFNFDIDLVLKLEEATQKTSNIKALTTTKNYVEGVVKTKLYQTAENSISKLINTSKANNADVFEVYDYFNKFHNSEWKQFLNTLENKDDYLNYVTFTLSLKLQGKI